MVEANPPAAFSLARMTELAERCQQDGENIPVEEFCDLLDMIVLLLQGMGSLMSVAFSGKFEYSSSLSDVMLNQFSLPFT